MLVVLDRAEVTAWRSLRNVAAVHVLASDQLNTYDVVIADQVVFSKAALDAFLARTTVRSAAPSTEEA